MLWLETKGTGVNPIELSNAYGPDTLRYFLMREIHWDQDGEFLESRLINRHNAELSDGIGNLISRIYAMINKYFNGHLNVDPKPKSQVLCGVINKKIGIYIEQQKLLNITKGLEICHEMVRDINVFIDRNKPWKIAKDPEQRHVLAEQILESLVSTLVTCICLFPYIPNKMKQVFEAFDLSIDTYASLEGIEKLFQKLEFKTIESFKPIFPRIEESSSN